MGHVEVLLHTFPVTWEDISLASWMKYPHPTRPDVLSVDVLDRHYNHETGKLAARWLGQMFFAHSGQAR